MLTQHLKYVKPSFQAVKFLTATAIISATAALLPLTAQASPGLGYVVQQKYSVKFERALLESDTGLKQIYTTLRKKAERACKFGRAVDQDGEVISKSDCISDMVDQFVESADVITLTAYHMEQEKMGG